MQLSYFSKIKDSLNRNTFIKNIIILLSGSSIALVIPLLITPIIARFFSPSDFGLWGIYSAIVGIFAVIANGRYELSILLPKKDSEAFNMFTGAIGISVILSIIILILIIFFGHYLCNIVNSPDLYYWLYLIPIAIVFIGIQQAANYWLNRETKFKVLSVGKVIQSSSTGTLNLVLGKFMYFSGGLIVSTIVGQIILAGYYLNKINLKKNIKNVSKKEILNTLYKYREFPIKSGMGIFLNILKEQAPIFLFGYYFDNLIVGFYTLIIRLFSVPLSLIAGSIGQVYYQKAVELNNNNQSVLNLYVKTSLRLIIVTIIPLIFIAIWGEKLFPIVFGNEWAEAGKMLVIFSFYYAVRFVVSSQSSLLMVYKKLNIEVIFNFVALVLQILALVIGGVKQNYMISLYLIAISGSLMYFMLGIYFLIFLKHKNEKVA